MRAVVNSLQRTADAARDRRVLVVDDDPDFAETLRKLLLLEGYAAVAVHDATAAREVLNRAPPAVALVDVRLGTESGLALVSELGQRWPEVTCVVMTAYASTETAIKALHEGAYDYLCKPFYTEDLLATLERCFERALLKHRRKEAEAALRRRNRELETVNARLQATVDSLRKLSTSASHEQLIAETVSEIARHIGAEQAAVHHLALPAGRTMPERALQLARSFLAEIPDLTDGSSAERLAREWPADGQSSVLLLPLTGEGRALIALLVFEAHPDRPFSPQDRELGMILASYASEGVRLLQAMERLSLSEERLRHIIDASPSLIALTDPNGRLVLANKRLEEWHGCRREEVLGKPWRQALPPVVAELYARSGLDTGEPLEEPAEAEIEAPLTGGAPRSLLLNVFPVRDLHGRSIGRGAIATDITDYRRAQERLRHSQKMETLGRITGGIAHEFNNLLAVITGNLEFMRRSVDGDSAQREIIEDALASARSGTDLIRQLLALGRRQPLSPKRTDVAAHIRGTMRLLQRTLGENVRIECFFDSQLWAAEVDRRQFEASLLNLALNARDAMPEGGVLRITAENSPLGNRGEVAERNRSAGYVVVSLSDNGIGMPADVLRQATEPFFTTKPAGQGSGLGLSMVNAFVEQSGGHIELQSEVGTGTTVRLFLPAAKSRSQEAHVASSRAT
jgi:PAS domain S-box-containing protein